jgi:hypothetical protein
LEALVIRSTAVLLTVTAPAVADVALAYDPAVPCSAQATACREEGELIFAAGGSPEDLAGAATLFDQSCEAGESVGCVLFAVAMWRGQGIEQDRERAAALLRQACDANVPLGCFSLAASLTVEGPEHDYATALPLYEKACAASLWDACFNLGLMFETPTGVPRDPALNVGSAGGSRRAPLPRPVSTTTAPTSRRAANAAAPTPHRLAERLALWGRLLRTFEQDLRALGGLDECRSAGLDPGAWAAGLDGA